MKKWLLGVAMAVSIAVIVAALAPDIATGFAWIFLAIVAVIVLGPIVYLIAVRMYRARSTPATVHAAPHTAGHGGGHGHGSVVSTAFTVVGVVVGIVMIIGVVCLFILFLHSAQTVTSTRQTVSSNTPVVDSSCIFTTQPQLCRVDVKGKAILLAAGIREGMTFCITPSINEADKPEGMRVYKSVMRILKTGEMLPYDQYHPDPGMDVGYQLVPKKPAYIRQFVAETPDAAGC